jgi:hypothetical protein
MSRPAPTIDQLISIINILDNDDNPPRCCRNCYSIFKNPMRCSKCNLNRCGECEPIPISEWGSLAAYLCLELGLGSQIIESFGRVYFIDVIYCPSCNNVICNNCTTVHIKKRESGYIVCVCDDCFERDKNLPRWVE